MGLRDSISQLDAGLERVNDRFRESLDLVDSLNNKSLEGKRASGGDTASTMDAPTTSGGTFGAGDTTAGQYEANPYKGSKRRKRLPGREPRSESASMSGPLVGPPPDDIIDRCRERFVSETSVDGRTARVRMGWDFALMPNLSRPNPFDGAPGYKFYWDPDYIENYGGGSQSRGSSESPSPSGPSGGSGSGSSGGSSSSSLRVDNGGGGPPMLPQLIFQFKDGADSLASSASEIGASSIEIARTQADISNSFHATAQAAEKAVKALSRLSNAAAMALSDPEFQMRRAGL